MKLIVFSGLPGTGKSLLAESVGRKLSIPVYSKDWLEAVLLRSELNPANEDKPLGSAAYQLLTTLAKRQLMVGQSVILDSVASTDSIRSTWKALSEQYAADWLVVECVCSDESVHQARLVGRQRNIPGWHELEWADVEQVRSYYAPWNDPRLILDAVDSPDENIEKILKWLKMKKEKLP